MRLTQALGAFPLPEQGTISPLYVFFEITNAERNDVEICRLYVAPKGDRRPVYEDVFEGGRDLPCTLHPGEVVRFWVRAKTLAGALKDAGYSGRPRVSLVAEDGLGDDHEKDFRFRVDEYLHLRDE